MENRKKGLYTAKACRFCLSQDEPLSSLFEKKQAPKNSIPLSLKILSSISVEVFPSEKMPPYICGRCSFFMDVVYDFKNICREADKSILDFVQTGSALEPIVWPPSLVKLFRYGVKQTPDVNIVKVEGGATVEVSQSMSDDDEDENGNENVYNVKIGDGSEDGASACVKVVTRKEPEKPAKEKKRASTVRADSDDVDVDASNARSGLQGGCWACDSCECTYPLQQLLELHKMQKHRARDVACDKCEAKFFTKYDLAVHQLRHTKDMPFECIACGYGFNRLILLKRHEKMVHADLPQQKCPHCPASFLSFAELEEHQEKHARVQDRNFPCTYCDKRFYDHSSMMKHIDSVHECKPVHACEYCPEQFTSITKLTRHVRTHAGDRPYPCRHCDKSFTKSHHLTRHLRVKHSDTCAATVPNRSSVDEYRCEQCASAFQSQDELMYHSAIHATQNLTCPLCQERFPDVDAVTTHIKSHVTGMEFMCDFCELVFTSKEKLDRHIDTVHEDELRNADEVEQDDTSMDMDEEEEDDDTPIHVKQEGDHMVVEIKKPSEFMLSPADRDMEDKYNNTNSEESEPESAMTEDPAHSAPAQPTRPLTVLSRAPPPLMPPLTPAPLTVITPAPAPLTATTPAPARLTATTAAPAPVATPATTKEVTKENSRTAHLIRKAEEVKRKLTQETPPPEKKEKPKVENSTGGASDKSLRLLEKELQELQRTNKREEVNKTPVKALETLRGRGRPQIHTSTPKLRSDKKETAKSTPTEKKVPERRAVKENKKPEETKINNVSAKEVKEDKEAKTREDKEIKANVSKEESNNKSAIKNNNKSAAEEPVRRSTRPSKVKDYAKMVNTSPKPEEVSDDDSEDDDEEYVEPETKPEPKTKARQTGKKAAPTTKATRAKSPAATPPATPATPAPATPAPAKKRGRPRKDATPQEVPAKVKKAEVKVENDEKEEDSQSDKMDTEETETSSQIQSEQESDISQEKINTSQNTPTKAVNAEQKPNLLVQTPTGQTLKKVPIKSLPPGVKPLPLPSAARPIPNQPVTEMQIGKKMVKVQKIVMTKAEVEAMAKKGLVEMKDGTMVLKAGVKLPSDANALKSSLVLEGDKKAPKESPSKALPATPTRCEFDDA